MSCGYTLTLKGLCFLLGLFMLLATQFANSLESSSNIQKSLSQAALDESREKRNAEIDLASDDNIQTNKRYIPYEELQKRLRHFIGKRAGHGQSLDNVEPDEEKRMRYFVGKKSNDDQTDVTDEDLEKRMRYFVGKRSRLRYFVGKRENDDIEPLSENDLEKRMRYFVGKRRYFLGKRRYFLGKRNDLDENEDQLQKRASRLRYFVGKRPTDDFINNNAFHKRMRYFVGKRDPIDDQIEKRMRYFVGKRNVNTPTDDDTAQYEKRGMRYFVG